MTIPSRLSLVTLGVTDVEVSTRFYESLGFPLSPASVAGEVSFFRTAGGLLGLYGTEALRADAGLGDGSASSGDATTAFHAASLAVNLGSVAEVDSAHEVAVGAGARITKPPQRTEWGGYHFYFADPDGHLWEIAHNPFWPLDERGLPQLP